MERTRCGSSNNSCWISIKSGTNRGVIGLRRKLRIHLPSCFSTTHAPINYSVSPRLRKRRAETRPIRPCAAYATDSSRNTERSWAWKVRVTKQWRPRNRGRGRQVGATGGKSIARTQNRVQQRVYICLRRRFYRCLEKSGKKYELTWRYMAGTYRAAAFVIMSLSVQASLA